MASRMRASLGGVGMKVAGVAAAFIGLQAAIRGLRHGISVIATFDQEMQGIRAITRGVTEQEFARMEVVIRKLGSSTVFTAVQVASAMRMLKQGGLGVNEAIEQLPATLDLAAAGALDLETAAKIAVRQFRVFEGQGETVRSIADAMAVGANNAATNVLELSEGLKFASTTGRQFGQSFKEIVATLSAMSSFGMSGEMGGTSIRNLLAELANEGSVAVRELKEIGVTFDEINPRTRKMSDIFTRLTRDQRVMNKFTQIFNKRIMQGFAAVSLSQGEFKKIADLMKDITGEASKMAEIRMDSLMGDWIRLKASIDETFLSTGVKDFFREIVKGATDTVREISKVVRTLVIAGQSSTREFFDLLKLGFRALMSTVGNRLLHVMRGAMAFLAAAVKSIAKSIMDNQIARGYMHLARGMGETIAAAILGALPRIFFGGIDKQKRKEEVVAMKQQDAEENIAFGIQTMQQGVKYLGENVANGMGDALADGIESAHAVFSGGIKDITGEKFNKEELAKGMAKHAPIEFVGPPIEAMNKIKKAWEPVMEDFSKKETSGPVAQVGAIAGAINTIFGRSVNSNILKVNEDQKKLLEQILEKITPTSPTSGVPRFT